MMEEEEKCKNKGGRPRTIQGKYDPYDPRALAVLERKTQVKYLASLGCPMKECARMVGVHYNTFRECYKNDYDEGRDSLGMTIRKWQIDKAQEGCSKMLMYLGPVYCEEQRGINNDTLSKGDIQEGIDVLCAMAATNREKKTKKEE